MVARGTATPPCLLRPCLLDLVFDDRVPTSVVSGRFELSDAEYAGIAPLLPDLAPQRGGRWRDHRQVVNGIVFRVRTGVPWRDVPARYGPWKTLYKRFARWQEDGTWARIEATLHTEADAAGDLARQRRRHDRARPPARRRCS